MELIVVANDLDHVSKLVDNGIDNIVVSSIFSSYRDSFSIDDIKKSFKITNNLYVSFYDLISETNLDEAISLLNTLLDLGVENYIINDLGLIQFLKPFNVNIIYDNITLNTNYETLNILNELGINSAVCGREITLDEINEISSKTKMKTVVHIQGMFPIFTSIRKLVENYENAKNTSIMKDQLALYQRDRSAKYPIIENDNGVIMFSSYEQCGIEEIDKLNTDYLLIDQVFVSNDENIKVVKMYQEYKNYLMQDIKNISKYRQSKGFFFKKTMYKL